MPFKPEPAEPLRLLALARHVPRQRGCQRGYNRGMSLKNVDMESAIRRIADRRIEEAMRDGKFDNLAGMGQPLELDPMPAEENARMTWWCLRILKNNDFTPEEVRYRKAIDHLKGHWPMRTARSTFGGSLGRSTNWSASSTRSAPTQSTWASRRSRRRRSSPGFASGRAREMGIAVFGSLIADPLNLND